MGDILSKKTTNTTNETNNNQVTQQGQRNTGLSNITGARDVIIDAHDASPDLAMAALEAVAHGTNATLIGALSNEKNAVDRSFDFARGTQDKFADAFAASMPSDSGKGISKLVLAGLSLLAVVYIFNTD